MQGPPSNPSNPRVFIEVSMANPVNRKMEKVGRMVYELFKDTVPKTAENFLQLCKGTTSKQGKQMGFKHSIFHRIIPGFMCQGGDFTNHDGTGGISIYGRTFPDESFKGKAGRHFVGALSMANAGRNTNGSQFFMCTAPCGHLNGNHVVFGKIVEGMDVLRKIERNGSPSGKTRTKVQITDCGEVTKESEQKDQLASIKKLEPTKTQLPPGNVAVEKKEKKERDPDPLSFAAQKSKALAAAAAAQQQKQKQEQQQAADESEEGDASPGASAARLLSKAEAFEKQAALMLKRAKFLRAKAEAGARRSRGDDDNDGPDAPQ